MEKPTFTQQHGPSTTEGRVQAHSRIDHAKTVTRRAHLGAAAPLPLPLGTTLLRRLHATMHRRFWPVSLFSYAKPTTLHYIRKGGAHSSTHTIIWGYNSPLYLYSLVLSFSSLWARQELPRRACLLGRREPSWYEYYKEFFQVLSLISFI